MHLKEIPMEDQIVVTGYGAITPLGHDVERLYNALLNGESAVRLIDPVDGVAERKWMAACIEGFDPKEHVHPRKMIKVMCREIQLAFGAAMQACRMAGIALGSVEPDRLGTVFSGEIILSDSSDVADVVRRCATNGEMDHSRWAVEAMDNIHPLWMLK
ncbi:MAG: beta-ketoacyl synthase N-terminal-like domain-containing protein, partial [Pirellula staleyi]